MKELTHFSLFSGIGGFDLAAEWAGFRTVGLVEKNPYRQKVLRKHWPNVPLWEDIRDVTEESLKEKGILADSQLDEQGEGGEGRRPRGLEEKAREKGKAGDKPASASQCGSQDATREARARTASPVALVTGGFPCQPVSVAGKRRGAADDRWLWPEMLRVIKLLRPHWVVAENVTGIGHLVEPDCAVDLGGEEGEEEHLGEAIQLVLLERVCNDLEEIGYDVQPFVIPACAVNAPHRRDRVWIVAHSGSQRRGGRYDGDEEGSLRSLQAEGPGSANEQAILADSQGGKDNRRKGGGLAETERRKKGGYPTAIIGCENAPDPHNQGLPDREGGEGDAEASRLGTPCDGNWWNIEPDVGRVAHGIPHRVDRLAALGDAIVPQVAYQMLKAIAQIEEAMWTR